ncbi:glutamate receptor 2.7-like [Argentina anserina]|uniref:glutamate receptor 2.7-like n=1 Tax=Argentina anserina TaxID=57926 RepID=UPI00217642F7|nr:glutamate receptor 2.7-like [Potentilla anserina]
MTLSCTNNVHKVLAICWHLLIIFVMIINLCDGAGAEADEENEKHVTNIGAIVNLNSRIGKEQRIAMIIAAENFNRLSKTHSVNFQYADSQGDPLTAASAAQELIKERKAKLLIGMEDWNEVALVADVGNRAQVPVISFASPAITPPLMERRWPFLIRVGSNHSAQMICIADIVSAYSWKRVIVIYEDDGYGGDTGMLTLLFQALQDVGTKIEHHLVLPRVSSMSNPNLVELEEMLKLSSFQSRVFIVLQSSLPTVTNLFRVAKKMGLVGRDSAWIITEGVTSLLDAQVNHDTQGALGIKTYSGGNTSSYDYANFDKAFQAKNPEADNSSKPGIHALKAYDVTRILIQAVQMTTNSSTSLLAVLNTVLSNYMGLSGKMFIEGGEIFSSPIFRIINVEQGNKYKELNFWIPECGFSESLSKETRSGDVGIVVWPGNLSQRVPKGWAMPTADKPFRIGVPNASFPAFVSVGSDGKSFTGFCIEIFRMVHIRLNYTLPFELQYVNGSYIDLVERVHNKTLDAGIGDITIIAERLDKVEYTQPYIQSVLVLIVPVSGYMEWTLLKPFSAKMWAASGGILLYTILIIWFLERPVNPDFSGPLRNQIGAAVWFAFTSLFFAHRERLYNSLTKVVVIVWLFVVLILVTSYTANLSSILTIQRLKPNVTDIETLKTMNSKVGLDTGSFIFNYAVNVLKFKKENLITIATELEYTEALKNKTISAALLDFPEAEVFMNKYCKNYTATTLSYRFGGLGFIFQQHSPYALDFTNVILQLLEEGTMMSLERTWLTPNRECPNNLTSAGPESLEVNNFWGLYVISVATSTICLLISFTILLKQYQQHQSAYQGNASEGSVWNRTLKMARFVYTREFNVPSRTASFVDVLELTSSHWEHTNAIISIPDQEHHLQASNPAQTEGSPPPPLHLPLPHE